MEDVSGLQVQDALVASKYRVYPDTPLEEVIDLMSRRELRAVAVVGGQFEVLGVITSGDALQHLLRKGRLEAKDASGPEEFVARDVMTRTVLCVSEEQPLVEAAQMMVNRDVDQLPVVREGQLVGFVTRDAILSALQRSAEDQPNEDASDS